MEIVNLEKLIAPIEKNRFISDFWGQAPLHCKGLTNRYKEVLTLSDLDAIAKIASNSPRKILTLVPRADSGKVSEVLSFREISLSYIYRAFVNGSTIVINGVQRLWPNIATHVSGLRTDFGPEINCNLYFTPAGCQGFPFHCDGHDVFVLQLYGAKKWWIYDSVYSFPMDGLTYGDWLGASAINRISEEEGALIAEFLVDQGDFLYVPRGFYHKVVSVEDHPSLHLTISIHPGTWADLAKASVEQAAQDSMFLRQNCSSIFWGDTSDIFDTEEAENFLGAIANVQREKVFDIIKKRNAFRAQMVPSGYYQDLMLLGRLDASTTLERSPGLLPTLIDLNSGKTGLSFSGKRFVGPLKIREALEYVCKSTVFQVQDIPLPDTMGLQSKVVLARRLILSGLLRFSREDSCLRPAVTANGSLDLGGLIGFSSLSGFLENTYEVDAKVFADTNSVDLSLDFRYLDSLLWTALGSDLDLVSFFSGDGSVVETPWVQASDLDTFYSAFVAGSALRVKTVDLIWPEVAILVGNIAHTLSANVSADLLAFPVDFPEGIGRWSEFDTFLIQLDGVSEVDVCPSQFKLPIDTYRYRSTLHPKVPPYLDSFPESGERLTSRAGDVIYIPRGFYQRRCQSIQPSLQLEVAVRPITCSDVLKTAVDAMALESISFRKSAPVGFANDHDLRMRFVSVMDKGMKGNMSFFSEAIEAISKSFNWDRGFPPDGHFGSLAYIHKLNNFSLVEQRSGLVAGVGGPYDGRGRIVFAKHRIDTPEKIMPALKFIASNRRFKVDEIPLHHMSDDSKLVLARRLVVAGLLRIVDLCSD